MIISKTPVRVPMVGGGTDIIKYCEKYGGATISAAINKYIYIAVVTNFEQKISLNYLGQIENVFKIKDIKNNLISEAIKLVGLEKEFLQIYAISEIPHGTGLGSSGAFTVGLLNTLHFYKGEKLPPQTLAEEAAYLEINKLGALIGKQDQTICAVGGLKFIEYKKGLPKVKDIKIDQDLLKQLESNLLLVSTGLNRDANKSMISIDKNMSSAIPILHLIKENAYELKELLEKGQIEFTGYKMQTKQVYKELLSDSFVHPKTVAMLKKANSYGVFGKITGAGVGGFMHVYCPPEKQKQFREAFKNHEIMDFKFDFTGTTASEI